MSKTQILTILLVFLSSCSPLEDVAIGAAATSDVTPAIFTTASQAEIAPSPCFDVLPWVVKPWKSYNGMHYREEDSSVVEAHTPEDRERYLETYGFLNGIVYSVKGSISEPILRYVLNRVFRQHTQGNAPGPSTEITIVVYLESELYYCKDFDFDNAVATLSWNPHDLTQLPRPTIRINTEKLEAIEVE